MKSLFQIDSNLLKNYSSFSQVNDRWNIASYLNTFYSTNDAVAFSKLFYPDFEVVDDCVILSIRFDEVIFKSWQREFKGDIPLIEKMCNLYEVADYFHINDDANDDNYDDLIKTFGCVLKKSLEINLALLFPDRKFSVDIIEEHEETFITFYSIQ